MEKLQRKLTVNALLFVFAGALLVLVSRTGMSRMLSALRWAAETDFGVDRLLRSDPRFFLVPGLFLLLFVVLVIAAVGCVRIFLKMARLTAQGEPFAPSAGSAARTAPDGTDMTKYIRQLDEQLKSGLIDRDEYRALREKYERMGGPDGR